MKLAPFSLPTSALVCLTAATSPAQVQLDLSFQPALQAGTVVHAIAADPEQRILIGGSLETPSGRRWLARMNHQGQTDTSFGGSGPDGEVLALQVNAAGEIFIGGRFSSVDEVPRRHIARLLTGGVVDPTFDPAISTSSRVSSLAFGPDGQIYAAGPFRHVNGNPAPYVCQFDDLGALTAFQSPVEVSFAIEAGVEVVAAQPDGKLLVGGVFNTALGPKSLVRLNPDGSMDDAFSDQNGPILYAKAILPRDDGSILIAGVSSSDGNGFVRCLNSDGSVRSTFQQAVFDRGIKALALDRSGSIFASGSFRSANGLPIRGVARLGPNGTLDTNWSVDLDGDVLAVTPARDGGVYIGGSFTRVNDQPMPGIARLTQTVLEMQALSASNGTFSMRLQAMAGETYVVESSEDLRHWNTFSTNTATNAGLEVLDREGRRNGSRFFRARLARQ